MKSTPTRNSEIHVRQSETAKIVKPEIAVIERAGKKASASRETARAFLQRAGIVTAKGDLTTKYR